MKEKWECKCEHPKSFHDDIGCVIQGCQCDEKDQDYKEEGGVG